MRKLALSFIALHSCLTVGCAVSNKDMLHFLREHEHDVSAIEYRVGIPDTLGISAPQIIEIDGSFQRIQPDGKINLSLLGEVKVTDMTAKEIAAKLEVLLGRYYVEPKVTVKLATYASKKYYVRSESGASGSRPYTGRDTLLDVVMNSGITFLDWTSRVKVTRPGYGEEPARTLHVNVDKMIKEGDWTQNILLEPNDIVYIPPTPIAWVGQRVRELVYPVGPALQAYTAPADVIYADEAYNNDRNNGATSRSRRRR